MCIDRLNIGKFYLLFTMNKHYKLFEKLMFPFVNVSLINFPNLLRNFKSTSENKKSEFVSIVEADIILQLADSFF